MREFIEKYIRPTQGDRILDMGCGTGDIMTMFSDVEYLGFDNNISYIHHAQRKYNSPESFVHSGVADFDPARYGVFDLVFSLGVIHHLTDIEATNMFKIAKDVLKPSGRFVTADPCFHDGQNPITRFIVKHDRGQNVRQYNEYENIASNVFSSVKSTLWTGMRVLPFSVCILECER